MIEWIKYFKFLLIGSIIFFVVSCDNSKNETIEKVSEVDSVFVDKKLTRADSIIMLARELNIKFNESDNINDILDKVLIQKNKLIARLDSLDKRIDEMESMALDYKSKQNKVLRDKLLKEINKVKSELDRIKNLTKQENVTQKDILKIPEERVDVDTKTLEKLKPGNYVTRLNKYYLLPILVTKDHKVIIGKPRLDSTTQISGGEKMNLRLRKEINQIKKQLDINE